MNVYDDFIETILINTDFKSFKERVDVFVKMHGYRELITNRKLADDFLTTIKKDNAFVNAEVKTSMLRIRDIYMHIRLLETSEEWCYLPEDIIAELLLIYSDIKNNYTETIVKGFNYNVLSTIMSEIKDLTPDELIRIKSIKLLIKAYEKGKNIGSLTDLVNIFNNSKFFLMLSIPQFVITQFNSLDILEESYNLEERLNKVRKEIANLKPRN